MDNLLIGVDSIEEATILRDDLINILAQGGFELCKWASKRVAVLPQSNRGGNATTVGLDANAETTTLGLTWNCSKDVFKTAYVGLFVCLATKAIHSDGSLGAAESAGPYHTKLRILFSYFLIKKCLRYFSSNPNNNLNYNFHFCLVPNYIVLCTVCFVNTHISTYKYLNASRIVLIKKKCV
jgi:hypothetical protein